MGDSTSVKDLERAEQQRVDTGPPLPEGFEFQAAGENPLAIAEILSDAGVNGEPIGDIPLIEEPNPDTVRLPGGLVIDGEVYRQATVRELNGEDEEHISRAVLGNPMRFAQALLERGVVNVGPLPATEELLDQLLVGDRESLILGIRRATYGDTMEMDVMCGHCGIESKIRVAFDDDLPVKSLAWDANEVEHEIALRNGVAVVKLVTGAMQRYIFALEGKTTSEANTHLFTKCVVSINGEPVNGRLDAVRKLGVADRTAILDWLLANQPGPDYSAIKNTCTVCGKETPLDLQAEHLFPGIG